MSVVYLQADCRYNEWILLPMCDKEFAIENTIERAKKIKADKIVANIYDCEENLMLKKILENNGVAVILSKEELVNRRFLATCCEEESSYVIRVCADQVLLDYNQINEIMEIMANNGSEWFKDDDAASVLADIVSVNLLKQKKEQLWDCDRYFNKLKNDNDIKRYIHHGRNCLFDFRINSNEHFRICSIVISKNLDIYKLSSTLKNKLINKNNFLNNSGIFGSWILGDTITDFFFDENKSINPWWSYSMIEFIKPLLQKNMRVFEWGSGNSTLFLAKLCQKVVTIEHEYDWYEKLRRIVPENVDMRYYELEYGGIYSRAILGEKENFDVVVIDGRDRVRCAMNAIEKLSTDGVIIWDDTDRIQYQMGYDFLKSRGFKKIELRSCTYGLVAREQFTALFYREKNIFGI